jgi:hypothetical protein
MSQQKVSRRSEILKLRKSLTLDECLQNRRRANARKDRCSEKKFCVQTAYIDMAGTPSGPSDETLHTGKLDNCIGTEGSPVD